MRAPQRGFSLLEVIVAFSILALSLGVLMQIFSGSLRNADASRDQAEALAIAQSLLASAGVESPLASGETSGTVGERFRWSLRATPLPYNALAEDGNPLRPANALELWEVAVRVAWKTGDARERDFSLISMRVQAPPKP